MYLAMIAAGSYLRYTGTERERGDHSTIPPMHGHLAVTQLLLKPLDRLGYGMIYTTHTYIIELELASFDHHTERFPSFHQASKYLLYAYLLPSTSTSLAGCSLISDDAVSTPQQQRQARTTTR